jgi:hypothetical protein
MESFLTLVTVLAPIFGSATHRWSFIGFRKVSRRDGVVRCGLNPKTPATRNRVRYATAIFASIFGEQTRFRRRQSSCDQTYLQRGGAIESGVIFLVAPNNPKVIGPSEMVRRYRLRRTDNFRLCHAAPG